MTTETTVTNPPHVIPKGQPVSAIVGGVVAWKVAKGATVAKYDLLAIVDDVEITAAYSGRVTALMIAEGGKVEKGAVIAYIDDGQAHTPYKPTRAPTTGARPESLNSAPKVATPKLDAITAPDEAIEARAAGSVQPVSTTKKESAPRRNAHLAELVLEDLSAPKKKPARKRKMVNRTYSVAPDDEDEITRLVAALGKMRGAPAGVNESLLVRVAISQLVESARSVEGVSGLIEAIEARIEREAKAGVGAGRRRKAKGRVL